MQLLTCQDHVLRTRSVGELVGRLPARLAARLAQGMAWGDGANRRFTTGLAALDGLAPGGAFERGVVHELLTDTDFVPRSFALLLAQSASRAAGTTGTTRTTGTPGGEEEGTVVWSDPHRTLYPPALARAGLPLERVLLLHPKSVADELWAITECLRCKGVSAVVAAPPRLTRVEARRLQLAAETGGGVGLLIRGHRAADWSAATRWLVRPMRGEANLQRWSVRLVHGHGGRVGEAIVLEVIRDALHDAVHDAGCDAGCDAGDRNEPRRLPAGVRLRASALLADRPPAPQAAPPERATA